MRQPPLCLWGRHRLSEVAALPLCLLTPDMHNRTVIDEAFAAVQREVQPAMETNSVLSLVMAVAECIPGDESAMVTVLPGAMVATVRHMPGLIARPLRSPELLTPIGFMTQQGMAPTRLCWPRWSCRTMTSGACSACGMRVR